jgi:hypothetical protein
MPLGTASALYVATETNKSMNSKIPRFVGKVLTFGFTAGFRLTQSVRARRAPRSSWIRRTRFYGFIDAARPAVKAIAIIAVAVVLLLVLITSF